MRPTIIVLCSIWAVSAAAQKPSPSPAGHGEMKLHTEKLRDNLQVIFGPGGNVAVLTGKDGVFVIDDEVQPLSPALKAELAKITPQPVRFVVNTHWHPDHTGGNQMLGEAGAVIFAQDNVRKRLAAGQFSSIMKQQIPPAPPRALPVVTFAESLALHLDGETIEVFHVAPAHTDGDAMIYFHIADVLHTGDVVMIGYPFIDLESGGSSEGVLRGTERALSLARDTTRIIPGHGPVVDKKRVQAYRDMLATVRGRVEKLVKAGKSLSEVENAHPSAEYDAEWGHGFIQPAMFVEILYRDLSRKK